MQIGRGSPIDTVGGEIVRGLPGGSRKGAPSLEALDQQQGEACGKPRGHTGFALAHLAWALSPIKESDLNRSAQLLTVVRPAALPNLQVLRLQSCELTSYGFTQFCQALLPSAMSKLVRLDLSDNLELGFAAAEPLVAALDRGAMRFLRTLEPPWEYGATSMGVRQLRVQLRQLRSLSLTGI